MKEPVANGEDGETGRTDQALPEQLGRYRISRVIGTGTSGVVYEAFDPELERPRAIKLMQPRKERDRARTRRRFLREAQAMAKLSHPNVVAVYDVGTHGERPFVVMEYVEGVTLREWTRRHDPAWPAVLAKYRLAGLGLAAAHEAGLIHRDFKPANVLVAENGAVKVTDFGLVRAAAGEPEEPIVETVPEDESSDLTSTGALIGTPAYMAPEQAHRRTVDARSDQFAFCVSAYEALYHQHPFDGETFAEVTFNAERGRVRDPGDTDVDEWVFEALRRGLQPDPDRRWPSMTALVEALDPGRRRRARRWAIAAGGVGLLGVAALVFVQRDRLRAWWSPVSIEVSAVDAELVDPMHHGDDPHVGAYVFAMEANQGRATFSVSLPQSGRYYVWGLVWEDHLGGDRGDADSFFVYVDDGAEKLWHFGCGNERRPGPQVFGHWRWQRVLEMPNADSDCELRDLDFRLSAGEHRIVVRNREAAESSAVAARLARLVLTNDADWVP